MKDVAAVAGVSMATVSNVINRPERVARGTLARVQEAIDRLGFVRNDAARQLRSGQSSSIGFVAMDFTNPFFLQVAKGAQARGRADGLGVLLANADGSVGIEHDYVQSFAEQRLRGVLLSPIGDPGVVVPTLRRRGIGIVLVDHWASEALAPSVAVDNRAGGRLVAEHLTALGHRRIAFIEGGSHIQQVELRREGVWSVLAATAGVLERVHSDHLTVDSGRRIGRALAARRPAELPDAVFAVNDSVAVGIMHELLAAGIHIPSDIVVAGFDDSEMASFAPVPLTTVQQPAQAIGQTAVELLLTGGTHASGGFSRVVFVPELIVRESTVAG